MNKSRRDKIIYWIATVWLSLGMVSSAVVQLMKMEEEIEFVLNLGYPLYFLTIIGVWKILGVITILIPKLPLLKEWAYAGFFFLLTGALFSHLSIRDAFGDTAPSILLLALTIISWYFRPTDRKLVKLHQ